MPEKQFKSAAGPAVPIRVVDCVRTCGGMPAQWDGMTDDGRKVYARYRHSSGSVQVGEAGDLDEFAAVHGQYVCFFERIDEKDSGWDGDLTETELVAVTAGYVTWPPMHDVDLYETPHPGPHFRAP